MSCKEDSHFSGEQACSGWGYDIIKQQLCATIFKVFQVLGTESVEPLLKAVSLLGFVEIYQIHLISEGLFYSRG